MRDVDSDIRDSLERLTGRGGDGPGAEALWRDLVVRRRRRRMRNGALAALPLVLVGVLAVGMLSVTGKDDARSDVATGADESSTLKDFAPFEMTYVTQPLEGRPATWELRYDSWNDWELTLIEPASGDVYEPGFRRVVDGNTMTEYAADGTVLYEDRVDGPQAPLALMSRGPRVGNAEGGTRGDAYRHEYTSSEEHQCPDEPSDGLPWCEQPGETVVIETTEVFNEDGVPIFAKKRVEGTDTVVWRFEMLTYERLAQATGAANGTLRVENIRVEGNGPEEGGTERVVIDFNEALPVDRVNFVPDMDFLDMPLSVLYTVQGPTQTQVCDSIHSVPESAVGSVDLLIPGTWFAGRGHDVARLETVDSPAKFVVCGPHNGFVQYAVWGPVSADPADVSVTMSADRTRITIETTLKASSRLDPRAGQAAVAEFLDALRAGDVAAAAELWTGYPNLSPSDPVQDRFPHVEELLADPAFARILRSTATSTFVTPSTDEAGQVVTVLDARSGEDAPAAIAFLTGTSDEQGTATGMVIHRLPLQSPPMERVELPSGFYVEAGEEIVVPGVPLEGGARAFVNEQAIPVEVNYENMTMSVTIPGDARGDAAVTLVTSSPELPGIRAFAVTIREPS